MDFDLHIKLTNTSPEEIAETIDALCRCNKPIPPSKHLATKIQNRFRHKHHDKHHDNKENNHMAFVTNISGVVGDAPAKMRAVPTDDNDITRKIIPGSLVVTSSDGLVAAVTTADTGIEGDYDVVFAGPGDAQIFEDALNLDGNPIHGVLNVHVDAPPEPVATKIQNEFRESAPPTFAQGGLGRSARRQSISWKR